MALLREPNCTPPDGFRYVQPETQTRFSGETLTELADLVIAHRAFKGIMPLDKPTVEKEIQRQICAGMFPYICQAEPGEKYEPFEDRTRNLDVDKIMSFTSTAFAFIASGGEMVSREETHRRANICRGCPFNRPAICICTTLYKMIASLVPESRREPGLAICGICGCSLAAKTLLPMSTIQQDNTQRNIRVPDWCWMKPSGQAAQTT